MWMHDVKVFLNLIRLPDPRHFLLLDLPQEGFLRRQRVSYSAARRRKTRGFFMQACFVTKAGGETTGGTGLDFLTREFVEISFFKSIYDPGLDIHPEDMRRTVF